MNTEPFGGDKKRGQSLLGPIERPFINAVVPRLPAWMTSYGLTLMTIVWSLVIIAASYMAQWNIHWLWLVSLMIFFQWLTDSLDGSLGKYRGEGLIRWGYYMDHFLDYLFLCSILIGYSLMLPDSFKYLLFFILAIFGAFMTNSFLAFASTNQFQISYMGIGPTEIRILFIVINTLLIFFGKTYMASALPFVLLFSLCGLIVVVYKTQKEIWHIDMKNKKKAYETTDKR